jgi:CheY-like chemotaxis protein
MTISALIIDDEQLAREELKYLLDSVGGVDVVAQGANGIEAVDLIEEHHPDLVFLDVQMPGQDGFAVIQRLMDRNRVGTAAPDKRDAEKRESEKRGATSERRQADGGSAAFCVCDSLRPVRGARLRRECRRLSVEAVRSRAGS